MFRNGHCYTPKNKLTQKRKIFRISAWRSYPERNLHTRTRQTRMPGRHQHKIFASPIGAATRQTRVPGRHERNISACEISALFWRSYPERNLHTAMPQTRMPRRHQHKIFASPIGTATLNAIYTQERAAPVSLEDIITKFLHLLLAQLPRTQFTHSNAPNPHGRKTSTQNFGISYWHSYAERNLHTATRQTRAPGRRQRKIFASPIGAATPNAIYTQQHAKPACQQDINTKFSHLLLAQLRRTQFTHNNAPNPHGRKTSTQHFRISYWHSYPERNLHTATRQTRVPGRHQRKIFRISYWHSYPERNLHTASAPVSLEDINTKYSHLLLAQLPQTQFTHSNSQTRMPVRHQQKIFASPFGTATPKPIYTQQRPKPAWQEDINTKFSHLLLAQLPRTQFTHNNAPNPQARQTSMQNFRVILVQLPRTRFTHSNGPNPHARKTSTQNFRISYWRRYPERNLHTAARQTRIPGRHQHKIFASPIGSYWHSYPERNLHTATRQTRMPGRHQHKIFASPIGAARMPGRRQRKILASPIATATPNAIFTHRNAPNPHARKTIFASPIGATTPIAMYTQQRAKPACQEDINAKFSHLLLEQLPRTQFTHSNAPNPHARKTSTQNFRISYWHSYAERNLHTATRQTRMPGRQRKIFASPIGAATPNAIYTQQCAKPACQEDITKFSHLLLAQLPQTQFTHSNVLNPAIPR